MSRNRLSQITMGYHEAQDRIWIADPDQASRLWLTYRMARNLLAGATKILEKTRENLDVPWKPDDEEQLKLEKEEAAPPDWLERGGDEGRRVKSDAPPLLVTGVAIRPDRKRFRVAFAIGKDERYAALDRMEFHRFSRSLYRMCHAAQWQIAGLPAWFCDDTDLKRR